MTWLRTILPHQALLQNYELAKWFLIEIQSVGTSLDLAEDRDQDAMARTECHGPSASPRTDAASPTDRARRIFSGAGEAGASMAHIANQT